MQSSRPLREAARCVFLLLVLCPLMQSEAAASNLTLFRTVYNTDVYATGCGGMYSAAGGSGSITISGIAGPVTAAYLYWNGQSNNLDGTFGSQFIFNGSTMAGLNLGPSHDNSWGLYRAEVTGLM